jgi:hypothetical protein
LEFHAHPTCVGHFAKSILSPSGSRKSAELIFIRLP